ncbi:transcriptional activator RfaH [Rhodobacterales bacterium LSUCC0387]|nr:transcriptional activator RfaH [Rhodobacterales bacterium LSUCC0387]
MFKGLSEWYVVQFKPNSHNIALRNLNRQGFETFLPMLSVTSRVGSRFVSKSRPVFPGYLFVALDAGQGAWRKINSTYGVARIVSFAGQPSPVPHDLVAGLQARCDDAGVLTAASDLAPRDQVTMQQGPFSQFVATVESLDEDQRVWVLIDLMGQKTRINVAHEDLTKI